MNVNWDWNIPPVRQLDNQIVVQLRALLSDLVRVQVRLSAEYRLMLHKSNDFHF